MRTFKKFSARLIAAFLTVASFATAAHAQTFSIRVKVPFAFQTSSGLHLPPGMYVISDSGMHTMLIRGANTSGFDMIWNQEDASAPASRGKALFNRYGDTYYLHSVSMAGSRTRVIFHTSKQERRLQIAGVRQPSTEEVAMVQAGN